ncbi:hypothetical protein BDP67DRAFT_65470 [Colletotrichum lupini]|nr:hypothetical protein BDP67DRAFT_65470 [Colletotrichum lupini]
MLGSPIVHGFNDTGVPQFFPCNFGTFFFFYTLPLLLVIFVPCLSFPVSLVVRRLASCPCRGATSFTFRIHTQYTRLSISIHQFPIPFPLFFPFYSSVFPCTFTRFLFPFQPRHALEEAPPSTSIGTCTHSTSSHFLVHLQLYPRDRKIPTNPNLNPNFNSITATSIPSPWLIFSFLHHQTDHTRRSLRQLLPT